MQSSKSPPSPRKKLKSPLQDIALNPKTSITCSNVPESLFDPPTVKKHFSKFGRVLKIRLFSKRRMCIIEYEQPSSAERALLNAGAFDGFMFDVTRSKPRVRRRSTVKEDDPDWVPDSDVEEELSAMGSTPTYRVTRQNAPNIQPPPAAVPQLSKMKVLQRTVKNYSPLKKKLPVREKPIVMQTASNILEPPMAVTTTQTTLSMSEAASELLSLQSKISLTPDEKWRVLDARDRVLRAWGGAGSRIKVGGATIGTCQDMCPEKELLQRQAEHQVMTLETVLDSDGDMEPWRAVKQYSRSSADQEIPMCYELRPTQALMRTTAYLLHEIADTKRQVSLADWFHFMWDRLRGIRKDITQQALCCQDSICLVEMCARFHAHCAARLADLEHTQFDQKLNTDNLTKCLQTLKHMYTDVGALQKPREAEFRGYIALLNLGDANFWWEIQQLPEVIQKSEPIEFAIKVFNAIDNNNYVRFFRLVKNEATYLQACILLRYFNDVRARGLARIVKAYAPRGGSRYPAVDMMRILAFESNESLKSFINHYGLRFGRTDDSELSVILDRNQFIEDSDPYPIARAINLIESKRNCTVGEIIAGGTLPDNLLYKQHSLHSSFTPDGKLKESALVAEEQGYNTANDSNKDVKALKAEIQRLSQGSKLYPAETTEPKTNIFVKTDPKLSSPKSARTFTVQANAQNDTNLFSFKPAIPVASTDIINNSSDKTFNSDKNIFSFSKPQETVGTENIFGFSESKFDATTRNTFSKPSVDNDKSHPIFETTNYKDNIFKEKSNETTIFKQATESNSANLFAGASSNIFSANESNQQQQHSLFGSKNIFAAKTEKVEENKTIFGGKNLFVTKEEKSTENQTSLGAKNIFAAAKSNLFEKPNSTTTFEKSSNIFTKPVEINNSSNIFGAFGKTSENTNTFAKSDINKASTIFSNGKTTNAVSPASLFKSIVNGSDTKSYSIFQSKNKAQTVADNILNSVTTTHASSVYEFNQNDNEYQNDLDIQRLQDQKVREEERKQQEKQREEEMRKEELRRQEEEKLKEEARKKKELQLLEQKRRSEELRKQEELRMKLESEKKKIEQEKKAAELKQKADEERKYREKVDKESADLVEEIIDEINIATVKDIMKEENEKFNLLMQFAESVTDEIISNLCTTICKNELKAEQFLTKKIMRKWYSIWRNEYIRNIKRRNVLNDTPVWLTQNTPDEEAVLLHRIVENAALNNMHAIHRGYRFTGELKTLPTPEPFDIMAIIRSPLLKRMKEIKYPYDKCFFWKITLVSPGSRKWIHRKINVEKWLLDVFSDKKKHDVSDSLIHVGKQSWNRLMDFAISVSITGEKQGSDVNEAINGANGLLFYATQLDNDLLEVINNTLKYKYPYQVVPIAVIVPVMANDFIQTKLEVLLNDLVKSNIIIAYKVFVISSNNVFESLNVTTKTAMKWLAKKYPRIPPLEVDYLKSVCQRYLGNEIWCRLKLNRNGRMHFIAKDLYKLVRCYNAAVDKLTEVITNEDLFNYSSFPLEFQPFLDSTSPYPKPFEFIPSSVKSSENLLAIKRIMKKLKLSDPSSDFNPVNAITMQQQITSYCNQIGWFDNPKEVVDKVVAVLPNELSNVSLPCADFRQYYAQYNLLDFMNIIVYEKIKSLENFENRFAIYEKPVLEDYREALWLHDLNIIKDLKHKALEYEDEIDFFIEAKRRKVAMDSLELLMLEDKDVTMVEEDIKEKDLSICKYNNCTEAVKQLENMLEKEKMKSLQFENFLKAALGES